MISGIGPYRVTELRSISRFISQHLDHNTVTHLRLDSQNISFLFNVKSATQRASYVKPEPVLVPTCYGLPRQLTVPSCVTQPENCEHIAIDTSLQSYDAAEVWEHVRQCFSKITFEGRTFHGRAKIIASLTRDNIAAREDAMYNKPWSQTEKDEALARCRRSQRARCVPNTQLTLHTVTDEEGRPLEDANEFLRQILEIWGRNSRRLPGPILRDHSRLVQRALDDI